MLSYSFVSAVLLSKWWLNSTKFLQRRLMQHFTTCNDMERGDRKPDQFDCQLHPNNELAEKKSTIFEHNAKRALLSRNSAIYICQAMQCNKLRNKVSCSACRYTYIFVQLNVIAIDGLLEPPGKACTLLGSEPGLPRKVISSQTFHTHKPLWLCWMVIYLALAECHDILFLDKRPIKWRQRSDMTGTLSINSNKQTTLLQYSMCINRREYNLSAMYNFS